MWDVDVGLPADQAGMKEGDRLLAVNGESIEGLDHQQTVLRIRARDDQVTLLVIDPAGDAFYHSVGFGEHWSAARLDDGVDALPQGLHSEVLSRGPGLPWNTESFMLSLFCSSRLGCPLCCPLRIVTLPQAPIHPPCPLPVPPLDSVTLRWDQRDLAPGWWLLPTV